MLTFYSHVQAGKHYQIDIRTAKRKYFNVEYLIDKSTEHNPNTKLLNCKVCNSEYASFQGRHGKCPACKKKIAKKTTRFCKICDIQSSGTNKVNGYSVCRKCTDKGLGRKLQAEKVSKMYKGDNNPNYVHGNSTAKIWQNSRWAKLRKDYPNKKCCKCGTHKNIHLHHVIPQCFLSHEEKFNIHNIIPLCSNHHKELHHLQLDIVLLPILYQQYKKDALQLQQFFFQQPQFQAMNEIGDEKYNKLSLVQLTPRNYYKIVRSHHPEFFQQELVHLV